MRAALRIAVPQATMVTMMKFHVWQFVNGVHQPMSSDESTYATEELAKLECRVRNSEAARAQGYEWRPVPIPPKQSSFTEELRRKRF